MHRNEGLRLTGEVPGNGKQVHKGDGNGHAPVQDTADGAVAVGGVGGHVWQGALLVGLQGFLGNFVALCGGSFVPSAGDIVILGDAEAVLV